MSGRFAPSPTGDLHVGNLRTAAVAWLAARSSGRSFIVRMEDLDRANSSAAHEQSQLAALAAIGVDWDGEVVRQSERFDLYDAAITQLDAAGLVYPCFCTRREIAQAPSAPHLPPGAYPGTCRELSESERRQRSEQRPPALRLRVDPSSTMRHVDDVLAGGVEAVVDDVVLRRNDGVPAYNLAVVVDDAVQGVTQVVRADDLLTSTPRQVYLQEQLGFPQPDYLHVPLVVGDDGERLAKRHGAVTLLDLERVGVGVGDVMTWIARSLGCVGESERVESVVELLERFDPAVIPPRPVVVPRFA